MCCMYTVYSGMQEWVIQIPSIPILVSVLFPSLHLKYFRIKFLLLVDIYVSRLCTQHLASGWFRGVAKELQACKSRNSQVCVQFMCSRQEDESCVGSEVMADIVCVLT